MVEFNEGMQRGFGSERLYSVETVRRFAQIRQKLKRQEVARFQPPGQPFQAGQVYSPTNGLANPRIELTRTARTARLARLKRALFGSSH